MHREFFSYESPGERILKIDPHLPKLLSNIIGLLFFWDTVYMPVWRLLWLQRYDMVENLEVYTSLVVIAPAK